MKEKLCMWIAWKLPKRVVYWCFMRMCAHATQGPFRDQTPTGMTWETISKRWEDGS